MLQRKRRGENHQQGSSINPAQMSLVSSSSQRKRLPILIITLLCLTLVVAYYAFSMSTMDIGGVGVSVSNSSSNGASHPKSNSNTTSYSSQHHHTHEHEHEHEQTPSSEDTAKDNTKITPTTKSTTVDCASFDHGDTSPATDIKSLFNCNSKEGKCKWHYPAKFFDEHCGIGKDYIDQIQTLKDLHEKKELWLNGPPIIIPWAAITPQVNNHKYRKEPYPTHNISMTHVHKTGGTSLVAAFSVIVRSKAKGKRLTVYQPGRTPPPKAKSTLLRGKTIPKNPRNYDAPAHVASRRYNETSAFLDGAVKYRSTWGLHDHTLFAVIRDPAERFISAIGQATGAFGSSNNGVAKLLIEECVKSTPKESLSCFVDLIQRDGTLVEVHFTPMVMEISFATMWKDIPVAVFPFEEVPDLMNELGADPKSKKKDGHVSGYRKNAVLTNMTFSDYDDDSLSKLCQIYLMDVLFMHHLGYETHCDGLLKDQLTRRTLM